jgi:two-component system chemotaxis sensor kinase CheA
MGELFRLVHTLKGNSGLFDFPEMSRVLHAAEDLMVVVRDGELAYSQLLADRLLDAMDFVSQLLDEIESTGSNSAEHAGTSAQLAQALRQLIGRTDSAASSAAEADLAAPDAASVDPESAAGMDMSMSLAAIPEALRMACYVQAHAGDGTPLRWLRYTPEAECFFKGEDPFFQVRQAPKVLWQRITPLADWPALPAMDAYHCSLVFEMLTSASQAELELHFRYVPEQISSCVVRPIALAVPVGDENGGPVYEDFVTDALAHLQSGDLSTLARAARSMLELSSAGLWLASALRWLLLIITHEPNNRQALQAVIESLRTFDVPVLKPTAVQTPSVAVSMVAAPVDLATALADSVIAAQLQVLSQSDKLPWLAGRVKSVVSTLSACYRSSGRSEMVAGLDAAMAQALAEDHAAPLVAWVEMLKSGVKHARSEAPAPVVAPVASVAVVVAAPVASVEGEGRLTRRSEETAGAPKTLKVDQEKIDRLMNLIGEMVVAKNGLPYLASRAESVFGVRELSREIKTQYAVINRIAEEMQDAIMQVRMLPVSFVFQRFPRLVRDISRKLDKEVNLVLEGEDTEADKNIIESLADPLIHIVRNSLDHGLELPEVRRAAGKPAAGQLLIRATQEAGRVIIDIIDDGKGIDPEVIKRKAYGKGLIDEAELERMTDQEAINLVFAAGFSTVDVVSDLSGRGVGMDVVRSAVERVNGTVSLESTLGQGTRLRLSLPLSMAVTNVMIIESNQQIFGVPMDMVVETVRIPRSSIHAIKNHQTAVLRGQIVPLCSLNELLATGQAQRTNDEDELATLVVRIKGENVGIVVDEFREVVDVILKPMSGILGDLPGYTGSALLGDGSVLMVLNLKELV